VRTTAAAVALTILCVMPPAARAVDWSIRSTQSESVELSNNLFLAPSPPGATVGSYSSITANAEARTETSRFDVDSHVNYNKYWGPGAAGLPDTENLSYGFAGHYEVNGKNSADRNYLDAGFNQSSAAFALLGQLGVLTNVAGSINTLNFGGGLDRTLSALDTVSLSARSTTSYYDPSSAGIAFTDTSATASWSHRLGSLTTISVSSNPEWLNYENAFGTNIVIVRNQAGFDTTLSPYLSFRGNWGAAYVETDNGGVATPSSSATGLIYDMSLTYKALKNTTFTLSANQSVGPTAIGSLVKTTSVYATAVQTLNSLSTLSFAANFGQNTSVGTSQYASASVTYSRTLTREWTANLTYRYLHNFGTTGGTEAIAPLVGGIPAVTLSSAASSNSLIVVVSKSITLLPHSD
jgi:hypothetical protein